MPKLAFLTIGVLHEPFGHPVVQGFVDRVPAVFDSAESSSGFIDRSRRDWETGTDSWGEAVPPDYIGRDEERMKVAATLSLWEDLESLAAFAYRGAHGEAMKRRKEWFTELRPNHCAWWVGDEHVPNWEEAYARYQRLATEGASSEAFDLRSPFDAAGSPTRVDPERVKERALESA